MFKDIYFNRARRQYIPKIDSFCSVQSTIGTRFFARELCDTVLYFGPSVIFSCKPEKMLMEKCFVLS